MAAKISNDLSYPIDYREAYQSRIRFTVRKAEGAGGFIIKKKDFCVNLSLDIILDRN